ncbi:MAG: methyltransferase domain-containing protein [Anaerolineales bacterium]|jgi:demethylmenaquinone methyltransferase/2-methoxy-6-polyprenyl-1,4-benzoquinol methylase
MAPIDHFDLVAPIYDRFMSKAKTDLLVSICALPTSGRLLDAGGGTGRLAMALVGHASQLVVADSSLQMLARARSKPGLEPVGSMVEMLPFPEACFERILMADAYHHLADQDASLGQLWRVLAPGGRLVIQEPDFARFYVRLVALAEKLLRMRSHFVPAEQIAAKLMALGAKVRTLKKANVAWVVADKPAEP